VLTPLSWLKDFTPLETDPTDPEGLSALREVLDSLGLVVESLERVGAGLDGVVLARVLEIREIPGADRIRQVVADRGDGTPLEIVCGATNYVLGDVVPLAPVGVELPGGMRIERRKMRGVDSNGMLCSGRELGLSEDAAGLMILASPGEGELPAGMELGRALADHLGIVPDAVFDIAVEPNRPDCLSIVGIARDLAAKLRLPFFVPEPVVEASGPPAGELASLASVGPPGCDLLVAKVLTGVTPTPSPPLVQRRLTLSGVRPINSVVDASNYVMVELGQPTHPYDLDRLGGSGIAVRYARPGETLVTLDGTEHRLGLGTGPTGEVSEVEELVITDALDELVGLAGVMGGATSGIEASTGRVLLEVAHFDSVLVGRAAARHGLRTEASLRFWRGTDPDGAARAADRFAELVVDAARDAGVALPVVAPGPLVEDQRTGPRPRITLRTARLNALLGTELGAPEIAGYLAPIGFRSEPDGEDLVVTVPSFRPDTSREVDLIEEVARHHGYRAIARTERRSPSVGRRSERQEFRRRVHGLLSGVDADEAWTSSIVAPELEATVGPAGDPVELLNPVVAGETVLRTRLLGGLLGALRHNESHRNGEIRLFEVGHVFSAAGADERPQEREEAGVLLAAPGDDALVAAGVLARITEGLGIARDAYVLDEGPDAAAPGLRGLHPSRRSLVFDRRGDPRRRRLVGALGEVDPEVVAALGLQARRIGWIALDLDALFALARRSIRARPVSRFPSADVDLAFVVEEGTPAAEVRQTLVRAGGELAESVELVDVYRGPSVPEGTRSLTFRVRFCAPDRTLEVDELTAARSACVALVEERLPARLRS